MAARSTEIRATPGSREARGVRLQSDTCPSPPSTASTLAGSPPRSSHRAARRARRSRARSPRRRCARAPARAFPWRRRAPSEPGSPTPRAPRARGRDRVSCSTRRVRLAPIATASRPTSVAASSLSAEYCCSRVCSAFEDSSTRARRAFESVSASRAVDASFSARSSSSSRRRRERLSSATLASAASTPAVAAVSSCSAAVRRSTSRSRSRGSDASDSRRTPTRARSRPTDSESSARALSSSATTASRRSSSRACERSSVVASDPTAPLSQSACQGSGSPGGDAPGEDVFTRLWRVDRRRRHGDGKLDRRRCLGHARYLHGRRANRDGGEPALQGSGQRDVSHGCVRLSNAAALVLKRLAPAGTPVRIVR